MQCMEAMEGAEKSENNERGLAQLALPINSEMSGEINFVITSQLSFPTILKCRILCKDWKNIIDGAYNVDLEKQTKQVNDYSAHYSEKSKFAHLSREMTEWFAGPWIFDKDDLLNWEKEKLKEEFAVKMNFYAWLHHYLKNSKGDEKIAGIKNRFGDSFTHPLLVAMQNNAHACFDLLLATRMSPNELNFLKFAIENGHTAFAKKLIRAGADIEETERMKIIKIFGVDIPTANYNALEHAVQKGNQELIEFIKDFKQYQTDQLEQNSKRQKTK